MTDKTARLFHDRTGRLRQLEAGGICPMEIKHTHPKSKSPDERAAQLKDIRNACIALLMAQKKTAGKESA